jgi:hypothetical protein
MPVLAMMSVDERKLEASAPAAPRLGGTPSEQFLSILRREAESHSPPLTVGMVEGPVGPDIINVTLSENGSGTPMLLTANAREIRLNAGDEQRMTGLVRHRILKALEPWVGSGST